MNDNRTIQIGNICAKQIDISDGSFGINPQPGRVYDKKGIAPTLNTMQGGHRVPYIIVKSGDEK